MSKELTLICEDLKRDIKSELKDFKDTLDRDLRKELRDIKVSLTFINKLYEELKEKVNATQSDNRALKDENAKLRTTCDELAKQVKENTSRLVRAEQYSRNANVEIRNIPYHAGENLQGVLENIGRKIGEPITPSDIEVCHRVPVANSSVNKNIVVQFVHRGKRNVVLEKARQMRLKGSDIGMDSQAPFYVNEHLCPDMKRLLGKTTARKRETGCKFVWVRNGQIFARKSEASAVIPITCEDDLTKITGDAV